MSVSPIEAIYLVVILTALILTFSALIDARADAAAVKLLNGEARELAAAGNVRRSVLRIARLLILLAFLVPGLFSAAEVPLNLFSLLFIALPVIILIDSILDDRDRRAMTVIVAADLLHSSVTAWQRLESKIDANTEISQGARDDAHVAVEVANTVNEKIAHLNEALLSQGEDRADALKLAKKVEGTVDDTADKVADIHDATVTNGGVA